MIRLASRDPDDFIKRPPSVFHFFHAAPPPPPSAAFPVLGDIDTWEYAYAALCKVHPWLTATKYSEWNVLLELEC